MDRLKGYANKETTEKPDYWVWHSEKTKTTCYDCSKHDGKRFYREEDIPELPVHPNCKCWVEAVYENNDKSIVEIENKLNEAEKELYEINNISAETDKLITDAIFGIGELNEQIENLSPILDTNESITEFNRIKNEVENN